MFVHQQQQLVGVRQDNEGDRHTERANSGADFFRGRSSLVP
jgi:hypothetical protein